MFIFFLTSKNNSLKSENGRNPFTRDVYKRYNSNYVCSSIKSSLIQIKSSLSYQVHQHISCNDRGNLGESCKPARVTKVIYFRLDVCELLFFFSIDHPYFLSSILMK
jgi:hypothetical protein